VTAQRANTHAIFGEMVENIFASSKNATPIAGHSILRIKKKLAPFYYFAFLRLPPNGSLSHINSKNTVPPDILLILRMLFSFLHKLAKVKL
jgi:hypothetical protein